MTFLGSSIADQSHGMSIDNPFINHGKLLASRSLVAQGRYRGVDDKCRCEERCRDRRSHHCGAMAATPAHAAEPAEPPAIDHPTGPYVNEDGFLFDPADPFVESANSELSPAERSSAGAPSTGTSKFLIQANPWMPRPHRASAHQWGLRVSPWPHAQLRAEGLSDDHFAVHRQAWVVRPAA